MYCPQCQERRDPESLYCLHCGSELRPKDVALPEEGGRSTWDPPWRSGQVALGILVIVAAITPVVLLAAVLADFAGRDRLAIQASASSALMGVVILAVVWALVRHGHEGLSGLLGLRRTGFPGQSRIGSRSLPGLLGLRRPRGSTLMAGLLVIPVLGVNLGFTALYVAAARWASAEPLTPPDLGPAIAFSGAAVLVSFAALAVWTPITEEVFFRGFILPGIANRLGHWWAIVISATIFSAFHLDLGVLVPVFVTGLLLGWLYHRTGSIWPGVAVHAGQNSLALLGAILGV